MGGIIAMYEDPIVSEIRQHRENHAKRYNHDLRRISEALRIKEQQSQREILDRNPRRILGSAEN